ncbi:hypothetical protein [Streptomyces avermitilis]|uniref:hypothetical protein n=1 Tax=Streptomyces avermitilis TaxID=33903 RepID=UPI0038189F63
MAQAEARVERKVIETKTYTLELSDAEARTLAVILGKVAGSPTASPRKHAESVHNALKRAGVQWFDTPLSRLAAGVIAFDEGEA